MPQPARDPGEHDRTAEVRLIQRCDLQDQAVAGGQQAEDLVAGKPVRGEGEQQDAARAIRKLTQNLPEHLQCEMPGRIRPDRDYHQGVRAQPWSVEGRRVHPEVAGAALLGPGAQLQIQIQIQIGPAISTIDATPSR